MSGSLTVHVLDGDQNPVSGMKVYLNFPNFMLFGGHRESYTDDDGIAEFDEVPTGTVEVYVDGDLQLEVGVGGGEHEDVTVTI